MTHRAALAALATVLLVAAAPAGMHAREDQPSSTEPEEKVRAVAKYNLDDDRLAIGGYDPVAYWPEGDPKKKGAAIKGSKDLSYTYKGVTYRFSRPENRELFKRTPERYEPAYGGWCAYAMAHETYTEPSPRNFRTESGRLFLFYKNIFSDTNKSWVDEGGYQALEPRADSFWQAETREIPPTPEERHP